MEQAIADLNAFLRSNRLTARAFAARVGMSEAELSRLRNGFREPTLAQAARIQREAGIEPGAWVRLDVDQQPAVECQEPNGASQ